MRRCCIKDNYLPPQYIAEDDIPRYDGLWPEYAKTILLCVDSFVHGLAQGRIHNFYFREEAYFSSLDQMLFALEDIMDKAQMPRRDSLLSRSIRPQKQHNWPAENELLGNPTSAAIPYYDLHEIRAKKGKLASFYLRVYSRHHASLQGVLVGAGHNDVVAFRSEIELLMLLRAALLETQG